MSDEETSSDFAAEMKKMKADMKKMKDDMSKMAQEEADFDQEEINIGRGNKSRGFKFEFGDDSEFDGVDDTLNDYLGSVMAGVADNLRSSVSQMAKGFSFDLSSVAHEVEKVKHEFERNRHDLEKQAHKAAKQAEKHVRKAQRNMEKHQAKVVRFHKLSEEELEKFYETAPNLASALSDEKKLKLLKALEKGPMYQQDLSEVTEIKGGTFKHHMDTLIDVHFVVQEKARGRYLISQLGIEAIKLAEMLFRRFIFTTQEQAQQREIEVTFNEDDEGIDVSVSDVEIEDDIANAADAVDDMAEASQEFQETQESQNEEEEG